MNISDLLAQAAWKGTVLLAAGFAAAWLPARVSAAFRHYCWTIALSALLALPLVIAWTPKWRVPLPVSQKPAPTVMVIRGGTAHPSVPATPSPNPLPWIYATGVALVFIRFVAGAVRTRRMLAGSVGFSRPGVPRCVRVVESPLAPVPLVWGIFRPIIALPAASRRWPAERLRAVLLHELIHVQRRDLLAQMIAQAACCLYWFHPLAWIAAREQRRERERACDDAVLARGIGAAEYAGHLVDLVRGLTVQAPAMAEASDFEGRVRALLDRGRNRAPMGRGLALAVSLLALMLIVPMASITSYAAAAHSPIAVAVAALPIPAANSSNAVPAPVATPRKRAPLSRVPVLSAVAAPVTSPLEEQGTVGALVGTVSDPSGARIPGARIQARNLEGSNEESVVADAAGEFALHVPAGRYELEFRVPGFKIGRKQAVVTSGGVARSDAFMELGEVSEAATVKGSRPAVPAPRVAVPPQRIPIGGNVQATKLLSQPRPVYPDDLQQQGVTGTVKIRAVIGKDGRLLNPKVINTEVHPGLAKAALEAVGKWLYQPTLLNGQPVEVLTTIDIAFELDQ
jgi:TonB family protein